MYPHSLGELAEGWSKAFVTGAAQTSRGLLLVICAWMAGSLVAVGLLILSLVSGENAALWLAVYGLYVVQIHSMLVRIGSFRWFVAPGYPVAILFYLLVFMRALVRGWMKKDVSWKGRRINLAEEG
jgi:4,4'-diaponeurosporenoate glycosyltransferase